MYKPTLRQFRKLLKVYGVDLIVPNFLVPNIFVEILFEKEERKEFEKEINKLPSNFIKCTIQISFHFSSLILFSYLITIYKMFK